MRFLSSSPARVLNHLVAAAALVAPAVALGQTSAGAPAGSTTAVARTGAVAAAGTTAGTTATAYADATTFQENASRDGYAGPANLPSSLTKAWSVQLPARVSYAVIAGGRLFVTTARDGTREPAVYAYDANSGRPLWGPLTVAASDDFVHLTYDNGRLFAVTILGFVEALDPANGTQLWSRDVDFGASRELGPPVAFNGHLMGSMSSPAIWSMNEKTGGFEVRTGLNSTSSPVVSDGTTIYMATGCGAGAISVTDVIRWAASTCSGPFGPTTAVLHQGRLWSRVSPGYPGQILSTTDGHQVGTFSSDTPPAFAGSTVLLLQGNRLIAADSTTQAHRWTQKADGGLDTAPVIAGDVAYVGSKSGTMFGFSLSTGAEVWHGTAAAPVTGGDTPSSDYQLVQNPTIGDGVLAVPADDTLTVFAAAAAPITKPTPVSANPVPPVTINPGHAVYPDATAYQENPAHDGYAGPALPGGLHQRWSHTFGGYVGSPLLVGGTAFVPVVVDDALDVYAFRASTGAPLWGPVAVPANTGPAGQGSYGGGLAYDAGRIYALSGTGYLVALSPTTGGRYWSRQLTGTYAQPNFSAGPVAANGLVYVVGEGGAWGIREATGSIAFDRPVPGDWSMAAANTRGLFLGVVAFEAQLISPTGAVTWDTKTGIGGWGGGQVLHGTQDWIRYGWNGADGQVLDQSTGHVVRTFYSTTPPAFVGTTVVLGEDGTLTGRNAATGAALWSQAGDAYLDSPPVIAGNTAYVTSRLGTVFGVSTQTGAVTWQATLSGFAGFDDNSGLATGFAAGPMIGDGYLAVPNAEHVLTVFGG